MTQITGNTHGIQVIHDQEQALLRVTLDNGKGNRIGLAQITRLLEITNHLATLDPTSDIRTVILDATGDDFSHGANLADPDLVAQLAKGRNARIAFAQKGQDLVASWRHIPVPTIAVGTGKVIGAGACLYLASDFRIATPETSLHFPEIDRGMHLGWGIIPRLVALLGEPRAQTLALLGTPLKATELTDIIAITNDPQSETQHLADQLTSKPPLAIRTILSTLRQSQTTPNDAEHWADTLASADFTEAMAAWYAKRTPTYKGK